MKKTLIILLCAFIGIGASGNMIPVHAATATVDNTIKYFFRENTPVTSFVDVSCLITPGISCPRISSSETSSSHDRLFYTMNLASHWNKIQQSITNLLVVLHTTACHHPDCVLLQRLNC